MAENLNIRSTVKFNVGGRNFETSRSVIDQHQDTMLARLVSDTWQENAAGSSSTPIFIDRNGDIFAYVLDYLRYGSISLPITIEKEMFLRDLDYYGIVPTPGTVETKKMDEEICNRLDKMMGRFDYMQLKLQGIGGKQPSAKMYIG